jgi:hypothetical protein
LFKQKERLQIDILLSAPLFLNIFFMNVLLGANSIAVCPLYGDTFLAATNEDIYSWSINDEQVQSLIHFLQDVFWPTDFYCKMLLLSF